MAVAVPISEDAMSVTRTAEAVVAVATVVVEAVVVTVTVAAMEAVEEDTAAAEDTVVVEDMVAAEAVVTLVGLGKPTGIHSHTHMPERQSESFQTVLQLRLHQ